MEVGEKVGSDKLNSTKASHVFSSGRGGKQSIWTLGEIAFEKLLSPKFCKDSISQFVSYKRFLTEDSRDETSDTSSLSKSILSQNFDGYDWNRFGLSGKLADTYVKHRPVLKKFFHECISEEDNKLSLHVMLTCIQIGFISAAW